MISFEGMQLRRDIAAGARWVTYRRSRLPLTEVEARAQLEESTSTLRAWAS